MSLKNSIFIPCDEANHVCDKSQYKESTFWEKVRLNIHLIYCRACRKYTKNNQQLTKMVKKQKVEILPVNEKAAMQEQFDRELAKHKV